jgi:hypothetical protein
MASSLYRFRHRLECNETCRARPIYRGLQKALPLTREVNFDGVAVDFSGFGVFALAC